MITEQHYKDAKELAIVLCHHESVEQHQGDCCVDCPSSISLASYLAGYEWRVEAVSNVIARQAMDGLKAATAALVKSVEDERESRKMLEEALDLVEKLTRRLRYSTGSSVR